MEKKVAKIFKKFSKEKIKVMKNYRATTMAKGESTTGIQTSNLDLFSTIGRIMTDGSKEERKEVAKALDFLHEDPTMVKGIYIKY